MLACCCCYSVHAENNVCDQGGRTVIRVSVYLSSMTDNVMIDNSRRITRTTEVSVAILSVDDIRMPELDYESIREALEYYKVMVKEVNDSDNRKINRKMRYNTVYRTKSCNPCLQTSK